MAHMLVLELPGVNDFDILKAILARSHTITFLTSDFGSYQTQPAFADRYLQFYDR